MHIQLLTFAEPTRTLRIPLVNITLTITAQQKYCCTVNFWRVLLSFQCPATKSPFVCVLILDILLFLRAGFCSHSPHGPPLRGAEVISGSERLTVGGTAIGQPGKYQRVNKSKRDKKCIFSENSAANLISAAFPAHGLCLYLKKIYSCE